MLAKTNQYIKDAVSTVRQLTQEEKIRQQCEAREDYYRRTAGREELLRDAISERDKLSAENKKLTKRISKNEADLAKKDAEIAKNNADLAKKDAEIEQLRSQLKNLK